MKKLNLFIFSSLAALAFLSPQKTWGMEDPLNPTKTTSPSFFSSLQNIASNTVDWMNESALDGCERFGKWIASYAEDLPPSYFAKSLLEIDYVNDGLFWKGHFYQELEDIKEKPYLTFKDQVILKELQDIVWNGLLSPFTYEKALQKLQKQRLFYAVRNIRNDFESELKENPEIVLQHFRKDLLKSLEEIQNSNEGSEQTFLGKFEKKLHYYRNAMNAFNYGETLERLLTGIEQQKEKLTLSTKQHQGLKKHLNDALSKINKAEYLNHKAISLAQKTSVENSPENKIPLAKAANNFSSVWEVEGAVADSYFTYPYSFSKGVGSLIKRGVSFAIENPAQAITMGLAYQAATVAARSSFSSPQFNKIQKMGSSSNTIDLASLSPTQGFMLEGAIPGDSSGFSVSSAGDFNGDGLSDIIVGAVGANPLGRSQAGASYVIYGQKGGYPGPLDLASLNATQGVVIEGAEANDWSGYSVSSAGDFNGDGMSDVIVGAPNASPLGRGGAGAAYVVYGTKGGYSVPIDLASLNANQGVTIIGPTPGDFGSFLSGHFAGDFNGDGVSDVIVGVPTAEPQGRISAGANYVIYGKRGGYSAPIDLASFNTNQGVIIEGATAGDCSGFSVSAAGDFNGDGLSDVIVGNNNYLTASYVIYGKKGGYSASIDLASFNSVEGVLIEGMIGGIVIASRTSVAGDFNGDGIDDIIVGADLASPLGRYQAGCSYVIYGKKGGYLAPINVTSLNTNEGVMIQGANPADGSGWSVNSAGDFNGDGLSDVIIGAYKSNPLSRSQAGTSYIIYGRKEGYPAPIDLASLNATQGIIIDGANANDGSGCSVSSTGDFNGDKRSDILVGAVGASPLGRKAAGSSYVIYGSNNTMKSINSLINNNKRPNNNG